MLRGCQAGSELDNHAGPVSFDAFANAGNLRWFTEQLGPVFHFDAAMCAFFADTDGTLTLADTLNHWCSMRDAEPKEIGTQFEYNRFARSLHDEHRDGTRDELLNAWQGSRNTPIV